MFLLLSCWIISGIVAEKLSVTHYQLTNSSVCLHVKLPPPYLDPKWSLGEKSIASPQRRNPTYASKVDYNTDNHSLCIKALTDADSRDYEFSFEDLNYNKFLEKHTVIVEEPVATPVIVMSVLRFNLSAGLCNISVNCSIQEDWLSSVCDEDSCTTHQKSLQKVNITVSNDNSTVVCSGSNHVSQSNASESIDPTCFTALNAEHAKDFASLLLLLIVCLVSLFVLAFIIFVIRKLSSRKHNKGQTLTSHLIRNQQEEAQAQPVPRVSISSSSQADGAYENVDAIQPTQSSSMREEPGSTSNHKVDTVYSIIQAPKVTPSKDTAGHQHTEDPCASQSAPRLDAQPHMEIDTVYSLLQRPKAPRVGQ